jgi:hypothetical protein
VQSAVLPSRPRRGETNWYGPPPLPFGEHRGEHRRRSPEAAQVFPSVHLRRARRRWAMEIASAGTPRDMKRAHNNQKKSEARDGKSPPLSSALHAYTAITAAKNRKMPAIAPDIIQAIDPFPFIVILSVVLRGELDNYGMPSVAISACRQNRTLRQGRRISHARGAGGGFCPRAASLLTVNTEASHW